MMSFGTLPRRFAALLVLTVCVLGGAGAALLGVCGPFTDISDAAFCPFVLEIFTLGITTGTSPTTYDPTSSVTRLQMAAFLSRTVDGVLRRGSRRAALDHYWTTQNDITLAVTTLGINFVSHPKSDGVDVWVPSSTGTVFRVRGSDGKLLESWTGATGAVTIAIAMGRVQVAASTNPGRLYQIDPSQPAGAVTTVASTLGPFPVGIAFDGGRFWTASSQDGSISIVTPTASIPWTVTSVTGPAVSSALIFDGANIWIMQAPGVIRKLDSNGVVLQTVTIGANSQKATFDGANLWVPNFGSNSVSVVRASTGVVLATLTGNGVSTPAGAAFDGQRVLITNQNADTVSLFKAADLTPLGSFSTGTGTEPFGVCSDGANFWITLQLKSQLARF